MILVLQGVIILAIVSAKMYLNNAYAQEKALKWFRRLKAGPSPDPLKPGGRP